MTIHIDCPKCGEVTYPEAYSTPEEDKYWRICNGCGKVWVIIDRDILPTPVARRVLSAFLLNGSIILLWVFLIIRIILMYQYIYQQ